MRRLHRRRGRHGRLTPRASRSRAASPVFPGRSNDAPRGCGGGGKDGLAPSPPWTSSSGCFSILSGITSLPHAAATMAHEAAMAAGEGGLDLKQMHARGKKGIGGGQANKINNHLVGTWLGRTLRCARSHGRARSLEAKSAAAPSSH